MSIQLLWFVPQKDYVTYSAMWDRVIGQATHHQHGQSLAHDHPHPIGAPDCHVILVGSSPTPLSTFAAWLRSQRKAQSLWLTTSSEEAIQAYRLGVHMCLSQPLHPKDIQAVWERFAPKGLQPTPAPPTLGKIQLNRADGTTHFLSIARITQIKCHPNSVEIYDTHGQRKRFEHTHFHCNQTWAHQSQFFAVNNQHFIRLDAIVAIQKINKESFRCELLGRQSVVLNPKEIAQLRKQWL